MRPGEINQDVVRLPGITMSEIKMSERDGSVDRLDRAEENTFAPPVFRDATFLHAVLPYALGLSRRHGEPLSLLCVAIDGLNGIHKLLGRDRADCAVRNVGAHIGSMIRDSDIVARLDDDRIIVVLPRALIHDAWDLACRVCRTVEITPGLFPELPALTVSIGVAEFPACADNVYSLLDAADHALSMARNQGATRRSPPQRGTTPIRPTEPVAPVERFPGRGEAPRSARPSGFRGAGKASRSVAIVHQSLTAPSSASYASGFFQSCPILPAKAFSSSSIPSPGPVGRSI